MYVARFPICSNLGFLKCSFSPTVWLLRNRSSKLFFFLLGHKLGPEVAWLDEAHEARQDEFRVLKKAHLLNEPSSVHNGGPTGQVRVLKKKNCPKPNSLPFLGLHVSYYVVRARIGQ